jgi:hypothetical protein
MTRKIAFAGLLVLSAPGVGCGGSTDTPTSTPSGGSTALGGGGGTETGGSGAAVAGGGGVVTAGTGGTGNETSTGGNGGATGGAAGGGAVGAVGTLEQQCSSVGALACAGTFQKLTLVCGASGTWEVNQTCSGTQICDTREGVTGGTCQEPDPNCVGQQPGTTFCQGNDVYACDADTVGTVLVSNCNLVGTCEAGACVAGPGLCTTDPVALDCSTDCGGPSPDCALSECSTTGTGWLLDPTSAIAQSRFVVRTRDVPGDLCQCGDVAYAPYELVISMPPNTTDTEYMVEVEPPWRVSHYPGTVPSCEGPVYLTTATCTVTQTIGYTWASTIWIYATDPSVAAANLVFTPVAPGTECPG